MISLELLPLHALRLVTESRSIHSIASCYLFDFWMKILKLRLVMCCGLHLHPEVAKEGERTFSTQFYNLCI